MQSYNERRIASETNDYRWLLPVDDTEDSEFEHPNDLDAKRLDELAKKFGVTPAFINEIAIELNAFREAVFCDLASLLERIEDLERIVGANRVNVVDQSSR